MERKRLFFRPAAFLTVLAHGCCLALGLGASEDSGGGFAFGFRGHWNDKYLTLNQTQELFLRAVGLQLCRQLYVVVCHDLLLLSRL